MLQRLLDRFVPVRDDDVSWLDQRDGVGVGVPAAGSMSARPANAVGNSGERTLQH